MSSTETTTRVFQDYPGAAYVLPADQEERERLQEQHSLIRNSFNGELLADYIHLEPGQTVLDSGTGTGAWTMDLVSVAPPDVNFYGIDISTRLFPPNPLQNVTFSNLSITSLPSDWTAKFHLIHQRLLVLALRTSDWKQGISEMFRVLKPGGYVQLTESKHHPVDESQGGHIIVGPGSDRLWKLLRDVFTKRELGFDCGYKLEGWLTEAGFVDVKVEEVVTEYGSASAENWKIMKRFYIACKPIIEGLSSNVTGKDFDELLASAEKEWNETPGSGVTWIRFTARKPLCFM